MPQMIPQQSIVVHRDNKSLVPELGKPFEFSEKEVEEINKLAPGALRAPVNESSNAENTKPAAESTKPAAESTKPATKGNEKTDL